MQQQQRSRAYLWFIYLACTLCGGHYFFYRYAFHPYNSLALTQGMMVGAALWSAVLYIALLRHQGWARYVLVAMLILVMLGVGWTALLVNTRSIQPLPELTKAAIAAIFLYGLSTVPFGVSRSVRRYLAPLTAGGRWS